MANEIEILLKLKDMFTTAFGMVVEKVESNLAAMNEAQMDYEEKFMSLQTEMGEALARGDEQYAESLQKKLDGMTKEGEGIEKLTDAQDEHYVKREELSEEHNKRLIEISRRDLEKFEEHLNEYYDGNEEKAKEHYEKVLEELETYYHSQGVVIGDSLADLLEVLDEYYKDQEEMETAAGKKKIETANSVWSEYKKILLDAVGALKRGFEDLEGAVDATDNEIRDINVSKAVSELNSLKSTMSVVKKAADSAKTAVNSLAMSIASLRSKTITITVIRKTVYVTVGKKPSGGSSSGGGVAKGSNPFGENGGRAVLSAAEGKVFTEQTILPALKVLAREGKVEEIVS